jgi:hypothetical protein
VQLHLDPSENAARYQYWTPEWAAVELVEKFFPDLSPRDLVLEPSCGLGAFLKAIPESVPAIGVELDPSVAEEARTNTGREITGDFTSVALPAGITAVVGNPPFAVHTIGQFLARISQLAECKSCGLLLPAYAMQTHNTVERWREKWSMRAELIPRRLFPRLRLPLIFVLFERSRSRSMVGFALYDQAVQFDRLTPFAREILTNGEAKKNTWRALVDSVLLDLGEADLEDIYRAVEPRRPTPNAWWREKIRQVLQLHAIRVSPGRYRAA